MANSDTEKNSLTSDMSIAEITSEAEHYLERSCQVGPDAAETEKKASLLVDFNKAIAEEDERNFQRLLTNLDGNYIKLAHELHALLRRQSREKTERQTQTEKSITRGRKPTQWGPDGCGKLMVKLIIDKEMGKMVTEGNHKPKIKDAIVRVYGINPDHKRRSKITLKINDIARTYSEAKSLKNKR